MADDQNKQDGTQNQQTQQNLQGDKNLEAQKGVNDQKGNDADKGQQGDKRDGTIFKDLGVDEPGKGNAGAAYPEDWRERMAKGADGKVDDKRLAQFKRFGSPEDLGNSYLAAQERVRSGQYKQVTAPPDATDAKALETWRAENGVPTAPEGYKLVDPKLDPAKMSDADKTAIKFIGDELLKRNVPAAQAEGMSEILRTLALQNIEKQATQDAVDADNVTDAMTAEWGREHRNNMQSNWNLLNNLFGEEGTDALLGARTKDGKLLINNPNVLRNLNKLARQMGGDILVDGDLTGGAGDAARLEEIRTVMKTNRGKYNSDKNMQTEYMKILERMEAKGKL